MPSLSSRLGAVALGACAWAAWIGCLLLGAPNAGALELVVCESGPAAEDCATPAGVAADREAQLLYVADDGGEEIDVFEAGGTYLESWPVGPGAVDIEVDNDPLSPAHGDVYLLDSACNCVRRFRPDGEEVLPAIGTGLFASQPQLALGPGGIVHVAENIGSENRRVQAFDHEGNPAGSCASTEAGKLEPEGAHGGNLNGFAVDSSGDFYLSNSGGAGVRKYDAVPACTLLPPVHAFEGNTSFSNVNLAVDSADNLFVRDASGGGVGGRTAIYAYTPAGAPLRVLYGKGFLQQVAASIAPLDSGTPGGTAEDVDDLVVAEGGGATRVVRYGFELPGPVVNPDPQFTTAPEGLISNTSATLEARINPEGSTTDFHFEYVEDELYQEDIGEGGDGFAEAIESAVEELVPGGTPGFAEPLFRLSPGQIPVGCPDPENPPQAHCLKPETLYRFRAIATNADAAEPIVGPESEFETRPPFEISDIWSSAVGIDAARLHARVNPLGIPTEGHFQYAEETSCLESAAAAEEEGKGEEEVADACFAGAEESAKADFGGGEAPQARAVQLRSLSPGTAYRYRAVVVNDAFDQDDVSAIGRLQTFATPAPQPSCPNDAHRFGAGARLPDCRAYEMVSPLDKEGGEIVSDVGEELFRSAAAVPASGRGLAYSSHRPFGDSGGAPNISMYVAGRGPEGWSSTGISPPREGATFNVLISLQNQYRTFTEDLSAGWFRTDSDPPLGEGAIEGFPGLYRRDNATGAYEALCPVEPPNRKSGSYTPSLAALSGDGQVAVFQANDRLVPEAVETDRLQLYACADRDGGGEASDELPALISVLPGGEANPDHSGVGTFEPPGTHRNSSAHNAVSADGSRIYWTDRGTSFLGRGQIHLRENPLAEGTECDPGAPCTRPVSEAVGGPGSDAEAIFWTASPDGSTAIFSFDGGSLEGNLYRFDASAEAEPTELLAEGVSGLAGWSEDAERLYAVSSEALDAGALEGEPNLYLYEAGTDDFTLIATLPGGTAVGPICDVATHLPAGRCTRVSADGEHLLFLSDEPLTGYDNTDVTSPAPCGEPEGRCDAEIFLFDAAAPEGEELRCLSCNPTGARPRGAERLSAWLAARIPTHWDSAYGSRVLSADGRRVFFESFDALSPADSNGALDVYEWEEPGKGSCTEGRPEFSEEAGGCIALISSGQSPQGSWFADASADGSDVFFRTAESLWPADPGLIDLYDARAGGGYPPPEEEESACEGDSCANPPDPPVPPSPASGAFVGPEGLPPAPGASCRRPARKAKRFARQAKRLRRAARRSRAPRRSKQLRRRAKGSAKRARRLSAKAKRCRKARRAQARGAAR